MKREVIQCTKKQMAENRRKKGRVPNPLKNTINLTEYDIINYVQTHAKYLPMGPSAYHVTFEGRLYTVKDVRDLVVEICRDLGIVVKP